jgi:hypothetical protein
MNANDQLQQNIQFALFWEPFIENISIGVTAQNGIVTLSGFVDSYEKKVEIEKIVKKVRGVKALVEHLEVQHGIVAESDEDLAIKALAAIKMNTSIPEEDIKIMEDVLLSSLDDGSYPKSIILIRCPSRDTQRIFSGLRKIKKIKQKIINLFILSIITSYLNVKHLIYA